MDGPSRSHGKDRHEKGKSRKAHFGFFVTMLWIVGLGQEMEQIFRIESRMEGEEAFQTFLPTDKIPTGLVQR